MFAVQTPSRLARQLQRCSTDGERLGVLSAFAFDCPSSGTEEGDLILKSLLAIGQGHLFQGCDGDFSELIEALLPVEKFYKEMGGIVGYHVAMLRHMKHSRKGQVGREVYTPPSGIDISSDTPEVRAYTEEGLANLPYLAELYPLGGTADRLRLIDPETGEPLPAARLPFCGRTLLEGLIRDVQARENLYYERFGQHVTVPIAMMTSFEKENHQRVIAIFEENDWFGRPRDAFRFFRQPVVPTMDQNGVWCTVAPMKLLMKPGGHGVIWKVAEDAGVFVWLLKRGQRKLLVRQINNPIAGVDHGLLTFCGVGFGRDMRFGFASCPRLVRAAEGVNISIEREDGLRCLTNIEYCDFTKRGIADSPREEGSPYSQFPSNTNILFADIAAIREAVKLCPIPGMLVNLKMHAEREVARLESTMQNIADCFWYAEDPKTFLTYNARQKTISTTKREFLGGTLLETPEGCFYDMLLNAHDLLTRYCGFSVPELPTAQHYVESGPTFLFLYHPALGPLYARIAEKLRGGILSPGAEVELEIADVEIENLEVKGSLRVHALLPLKDGGKCRLKNVRIENRGIDFSKENLYWKNQIARHECCEIILHGNGEFCAEDLVFSGDLRIEVDSGTIVRAYMENGRVKYERQQIKAPAAQDA
ncbi:MAG: UTP--glucose-1-phosphate uridylyltransferase [Verrucomicrobia bacterium]|nr:UTP--glucose-1-phosphate uridylyltransferase [Verrucomicrobiota bacterium]